MLKRKGVVRSANPKQNRFHVFLRFVPLTTGNACVFLVRFTPRVVVGQFSYIVSVSNGFS